MLVCRGFTKDIETSKFEFYGNVPRFLIEGDYRAKGNFLGTNLKGSGKYRIVLEDVAGAIKFKPTVSKIVNGKTLLKVNKIKILLEPKK